MRYLVTSDIHLGHPKTPTKHIIASFKKHILNSKNKDIDVLFIAGDLFDRLIYLNTSETQLIIGFFHYLLNYCYNNNIILRVLEGTPSHDWYQSNLLVKLNELRDNKVNLIYHKVLEIEHLKEFNKYILYIPDEWIKTQEDLELQINNKLKEHNISKVDIAILHGQFKYQTKGLHVPGFSYDESYFLNLVKGYIHIGHYHVFTHFDRIIANGSLERLVHNEENPKGYVIVNNDTWKFIENPDAYTYITINITNKYTLTKLDKVINQYREDSYIRLYMSKDHEFNNIYQELVLRYNRYNLKKKIKEEVSGNNSVTYILSDDSLDYSNQEYIETNIYEALINKVNSSYQLTEHENTKLINYASVFKHEKELDNANT